MKEKNNIKPDKEEQLMLSLKEITEKKYQKEICTPGNCAFTKKWNNQAPLRDWAHKKLFESLEESNIGTKKNQIRAWAQEKDILLAQGIRKFKYGTSESDEHIKEHTTILENEKIHVTGVLDYDMDTILLKYTITSKVTKGLTIRDMINIA